jgi:hypothetical protein
MITKLVAIGTLLSFIFVATMWVDNRYFKVVEAAQAQAQTKAELKTTQDQVKTLQKSLTVLSTSITRDTKQRRLWDIENHYKTSDPLKVPDPDRRQEMRQLQMEVPVMNKTIDDLSKPQ